MVFDGTRQGNFTIVNFTRKVILIGGSAYTGEMKKGIFGVLNFPEKLGVRRRKQRQPHRHRCAGFFRAFNFDFASMPLDAM